MTGEELLIVGELEGETLTVLVKTGEVLLMTGELEGETDLTGCSVLLIIGELEGETDLLSTGDEALLMTGELEGETDLTVLLRTGDEGLALLIGELEGETALEFLLSGEDLFITGDVVLALLFKTREVPLLCLFSYLS